MIVFSRKSKHHCSISILDSICLYKIPCVLWLFLLLIPANCVKIAHKILNRLFPSCLLSVSKQVFMRNLSYEDVFHLHIDFHTNETHFHIKRFAEGLILKQRQKATGNCYSFYILMCVTSINALTAKVCSREYSMALIRLSMENIGIYLFTVIFTA